MNCIKQIGILFLLLTMTYFLSAQHICDSVLTIRDTLIQPGESVTLQAHGLFEYNWQPASAFANPNDSTQIVSPDITTDYILTGRYVSGNIVSDGDFEHGGTSFISEYLNGTPTTSPYYTSYGILGLEGTYTINTSSANVHTSFGTYVCLDHTYANGTGHCMYVNGDTAQNVIVWQETLDEIEPNTDYIFITWLATLSAGQTHQTDQLARLRFSINGSPIGDVFMASETTAQWNCFYQIWNSGTATSAVISIVNQCTAVGGNDFALDDISFSPMYPCSDTVTVNVFHSIEAHPDIVRACRGDVKTINPVQNDEFDAVCNILGTVVPEIVQEPEHATVTVSATGNLQIGFDADYMGNDTMYYRICCGNICDTAAIYLISTGFESDFSDTTCFQYVWYDMTYINSGDYQKTLTASNGCDSIVTLHLTILNPTITIIPDNSMFCELHEMTLTVESNFERFEWNTGDLDESVVITEPGTYSVVGSNRFCQATAQYTVPHCDFSVYIPNTITPGTSPEVNDFLSLNDHAKSEIVRFEIVIYDRWGNMVFISMDKNFVWDGKVNGRLLQNVIYTYVIKYTTPENKEVKLKGTLLVL